MKRVEEILRGGEMGPFSVAYCGKEVQIKKGEIVFAMYFRSNVFLKVYASKPDMVDKPNCENENCQIGVMPADFQNDSGICPCCGYLQISHLPICDKKDCKNFENGEGAQICCYCYLHDVRKCAVAKIQENYYDPM